MTTALIYIRVSSGPQEDGASLDTQEARCAAYCAEQGYQVIGVHSDTHTGAEYRERPALSALREQVRAGLVNVVVCYAVDRLSRNQAHLYIVAEELEDHDCRLEFVTEDFEDSAVGRFIRSARAFAAEVEREKIIERTVRGRLARVQSGKPLAGPKPLYGYQWRDDDKTGLVIDEGAASVVRRLYSDYATGTTIRGLVSSLHRDGIPSPRGKDTWPARTVTEILRNPAYTGRAYAWYPRGHNGRKSNGFDTEQAIPLPEGTYPPVVDEITWTIAQRRLQSNRVNAARNNRDPESALLRGGYARCGVCGRALTVVNSARQAPYYRCPPVDRMPGSRCSVAMTAGKLDAAVWSRIERAILDPRGIRQMATDYQQEPDTDTDALRKALAALERQKSHVAEAIALVTDPAAIKPLTDQLTQLAGRERALRAELAGVTAQTAMQAAQAAHLDDLHAWCERAAVNLQQLTYGQKRDILEWLGVSVRVFPQSHRPRYTVSAPIL